MPRPEETKQPTLRRLEEYKPLTKQQFRSRFFQRFNDPAFNAVTAELEKVCEIAWDGYIHYRKSPRKRVAGAEFAHPISS